jgi:hypothetical protein
VAGTFDYLYIAVPPVVAVGIGTIGTLVFMKKRKNNKMKEKKKSTQAEPS